MKKYSDKEKKQILDSYHLSEMPTAQDKLQTILTSTGIAPNPNNFAKIFFADKVKDKMVICPFCLNIEYLSSYILDKGLYKCKYCKNRMTEKTLNIIFDIFNQQKIDIAAYALWVYNYRLSGFFEKVDFKYWNNQMWKMSISQEFWDNYKRLKGESKKEQ